MTTFQDMGLPESLMHTLVHMQFHKPTPIQEKAIPLALQGKDILGSAQTGTGKTGAFGIPLVACILANPHASALVMTPTRELAAQVANQLQIMIGKKSKIKSALLIGGEPMPKQLFQLRKHPRIIVGTPGRINDHLKRGSLSLQNTQFLVLDETDRMLDMGFSIQIENVMAHMDKKPQTLLFSATIPKNIIKIADTYLHEPVRIAINHSSTYAPHITQDTLKVSENDKYSHLLSELNDREGTILIFIKTKHGTERMTTKLLKEGHSASAIHGDLRQHKRDRVIAGFRSKKYRILVATDVAARGLDIPHIKHVINYDLPQSPEDYVHRIGRTARAGEKGSALNLVAPADKSKWTAIERFLNPNSKTSSNSNSDRSSPKKDQGYKRQRTKGKHNKSNVIPFQHKRKKAKRTPAKKIA